MASPLSKWTALRRELGTGSALLYLLSRFWQRLGGRLTAYRFAFQPIPDKRSVAPAVGFEFRWLTAFEPALLVEDRREAIVRARFERNDRCLAAYKTDELVAFIWIATAHYPEDEARCDYRLDSPQLVWDYDVWLAPKYRLTRLFAQLWDEANAVLYRDGVRWSVSRISAFNAASLRSHQKRGARLTGSAFFIMLGRLQLVLASQRPMLHLSWSGRPVFRFAPPHD